MSEKRLEVKHATGDDVYPGSYTFAVDAGVLIVLATDKMSSGVKAYGRDAWMSIEYTGLDGRAGAGR